MIATLVHHPGVGSRTSNTTKEQDSLESLQLHMQIVAQLLGLPIPNYSVHTRRKDLMTLRSYGIVNRRRHDWGYYLGTGVLSELLVDRIHPCKLVSE